MIGSGVSCARCIRETTCEPTARKPVLADKPGELADASALHAWPQVEPKTKTRGNAEHDEERDQRSRAMLPELSNGTFH
jgi:hypothetical protein